MLWTSKTPFLSSFCGGIFFHFRNLLTNCRVTWSSFTWSRSTAMKPFSIPSESLDNLWQNFGLGMSQDEDHELPKPQQILSRFCRRASTKDIRSTVRGILLHSLRSFIIMQNDMFMTKFGLYSENIQLLLGGKAPKSSCFHKTLPRSEQMIIHNPIPLLGSVRNKRFSVFCFSLVPKQKLQLDLFLRCFP